MADAANSLAAKNGVQPTVSLPNVQTSWHNVFDADRMTVDVSPVRHFADGMARSSWSVSVSGIGGTITTITGVLEGTMDGTNFYPIANITTAGLVSAQNILAKNFRVRIWAYTAGTANCYRVGVAASAT